MTTLAKLSVIIGANTSPLQADMSRASGIVRGFASSMAPVMAGLFGGVTIGGAVGWGVKLAAEMEQARVAFEVLTGSAQKSIDLLSQLRELAASTPLTLHGLQANARVLLNYGVAGDKIVDTLRMLGDITGGNAERMERLTLAYGQVASAQRLTGGEARQLIEIFNPLQEISKATGRSMVDLKADMENGLISFDMVEAAFQMATGAGGRFHGMMDRMATTLSGRWDKLKDSASQLATKIGEALAPALGRLIELGMEAIEWFRQFDAATIQNTLKLGLWGAGTIAIISIVPRLVASIMSIVSALRAMATAQAIAQAFSGPKGWATLAISAAAAGVAAMGISSMFAETNKQLADSSTKASAAAKSVDTLGKSMAKAAEATKDIGKAAEENPLLKLASQITEENRSPFEKYSAQMQNLNLLIQQGMITWDTYSRAVAKAKEELDGATESKRRLDAAQRVNIGAATRFTSAGFTAIQDALAARNSERDNAAKEMVEQQKTTNEILQEMAASLQLNGDDFIVKEVSF